ncbi:MAG: hypothetical protein K8R85_08480 [Bacteroidetes bacterium]|nr:hypothetical protein [Bacteroidota bacterium]
MIKILLFFFLPFSLLLNAQEDAFDKYGPPGMVYTNLKDALVDVNVPGRAKRSY